MSFDPPRTDDGRFAAYARDESDAALDGAYVPREVMQCARTMPTPNAPDEGDWYDVQTNPSRTALRQIESGHRDGAARALAAQANDLSARRTYGTALATGDEIIAGVTYDAESQTVTLSTRRNAMMPLRHRESSGIYRGTTAFTAVKHAFADEFTFAGWYPHEHRLPADAGEYRRRVRVETERLSHPAR